MLIVKSIKRTLIDNSVKTESWLMVLHRVVDLVVNPRADIMLPVHLELQDTETGEISKFSFNSYSSLLKTVRNLSPYGFIETHVTQYRGDFLIAIDKLSFEFTEYISSVDFIEVPLGENKLIDNLMYSSYASFVQLDRHGTLFTGDCVTGTFACTLLDAICLSNRVLIEDSFYLPYAKARIDRGSVSYQAFKVTFSDVRRAKACLAKAFTLRNSTSILPD